MPVYIVTGKLGSGKTLACVGKIKDYLIEGRRVATNLNLNLEKLVGNYARNVKVFRVPDRPQADHLESLGLGYDGEFTGEEQNGALVLDECGTWFNSRDWNAKGRKELLDWVIHARKKRWNVYFIVQDLEVMDKQARLMFAEHVVYCKRSDRFSIPFLSFFWKQITTKPLPFPKVHIGFVKYGDSVNSQIVDRWIYRGSDLYSAYDTSQVFTEDSNGLYQYIPPHLTHGRYTSKIKDFKHALRNYKIKGFHFFSIGALSAAFTVNALVTQMAGEPKKGFSGCNQAYKDLYGSCEAKPVLKEHIAMLKKIKNGDTLDAPNNTKKDNDKLKKDNIFIVGSVKSTKGFDYLFIKNNVPFHPRDLNYSVRWISPCKALLIQDDVKTTVTCSPVDIIDNTDYTYLESQT